MIFEHALLRLGKINPGADFLLETLKSEIPDLTLERIKYLDFRSEDLLVPTYLTVATLSQLWNSRVSPRTSPGNLSVQTLNRAF